MFVSSMEWFIESKAFSRSNETAQDVVFFDVLEKVNIQVCDGQGCGMFIEKNVLLLIQQLFMVKQSFMLAHKTFSNILWLQEENKTYEIFWVPIRTTVTFPFRKMFNVSQRCMRCRSELQSGLSKKSFWNFIKKLFSSRLQVNYLQRILAQCQAKGKL